MGKKSHNKDKKSRYTTPFVSICTPTFNRRPFIPGIIQCVENQDYPKDKIEWVILDDGSDKIEDLVKDIPYVKYIKVENKMVLGKKRNFIHEHCIGDIIVYMDDDDYYPSTRISHAVKKLIDSPKALCAGASELYVYFKHINEMWQFGPYGPNHATAGTFAFKKQLLEVTRYNDTKALAEEKEFLKDYSIPFVQLEPKHTILVFSHNHNTFDKKKLLENPNPKVTKKSDKTIDYFVKEKELYDFFINIDDVLINYEPGLPKNKPDVLEQTKQLEKARHEKMNKTDLNTILNTFNNDIQDLKQNIKDMHNELSSLKQELRDKNVIL